MPDIKRILVKKIIRYLRSSLSLKKNNKINIVFETPVKFHYFHIESVVKQIVQDDRYKVTIIKWAGFRPEDQIPGVTYKTFDAFWHDWFNIYDILITTELERRPGWFVDGTAICMMHGAGAKVSYIKTPEINDYDVIFSVGPILYEILNEYVHDTVTVEAIGLPATDVLLDSNHSPVPLGIKLDSSKPTLLYAPSWAYDAKNVSMDDNILNELTKIKNYNVIIRPHPNLLKPKSCNGYDWNPSINKLKTNGVQVSYAEDHSVYELLPHIDLLIGDISSVTFEYLIFNRPIILYMKEGVLEASDAKEFTDPLFSATTRLVTAEDLQSTVNTLNHEKDGLAKARIEFLNNMLFNVGTATNNAVKTIEKYAFQIK